MAIKTATVFCKTCNGKRLGHASAPNHVLHLLLTLVTFGLWLPIWILAALFTGGRYFCSHCGGPISWI